MSNHTSTQVLAPIQQAFAGMTPERTPIWFMRQAGRYLPEYRDIRSKHSFMDMLKHPELAVEVTLQPMRRFDIDGAIIFSDILPVLAAMGLPIAFPDKGGPRIETPITSPADIARLTPFDPSVIQPTLDALTWCRKELSEDKTMLGFSGAPFTLACYAIEGKTSRDFSRTRAFLYHEPEAFSQLMDKLADAIATYLVHQANSGAQVVQLFDTWAGVISETMYRAFVEPATAKIIDHVQKHTSIPLIYFATHCHHLLPAIRELSADGFGIDWRIGWPQALETFPDHVVLQGNLDPALLLDGQEGIRYATERILHETTSKKAFIFNLGHGMIKETSPDKVAYLIEVIRHWKGASS